MTDKQENNEENKVDNKIETKLTWIYKKKLQNHKLQDPVSTFERVTVFRQLEK